jgi:L-threonylcarbamoyladenylate synthase
MTISIQEAAKRIRSGGLVAFPTETVYGLGANALDAEAVGRIFELKGRPATSPLIVHVDSIEAARAVTSVWPQEAERLAQRYWPGPLTMVLPKASNIPDIVTAGLATVGVRMPSHPLALELLEAAGIPVAAPSANRFMGLSPTTAEHVRAAFGEDFPVVDGGPSVVGIESTVVALEDGGMKLLRPGMLSLGQLEQAAETEGAHASPGMHPRHYSPKTRLLLVASPESLPDRRGAYLWWNTSGLTARSIRMPEDPFAFARRLYSVLHQLDSEGWPWIAVEDLPQDSAWAAIRDRLDRAASK